MDIEELQKVWETRVSLFLKKKKKQRTVLLQGNDLYAAEWKGKTLLWEEKIHLEDDGEDAFIKGLKEIEDKRGEKNSFVLVYNFSDLRTGTKQFPQMTEEELAETMYWEQDRIFGVRNDLQTAWRVLEKDFTGWKLSLAAAEKENIMHWEKAAAQAGKRISRMVPVTEVSAEEENPRLCLFGKKDKALCIFRSGKEEKVRVIPAEEAEDRLDTFITRLSESYDLEKAEFLFILCAGCDSEIEMFWKNIASERNRAHTGPAGEPEKDEAEQNVTRRVMMSALGSPMNLLPSRKKKRIVTGENRGLRAAQIAALLFFVIAVMLGGRLFFTRAVYKETKNQLAASEAVEKEMEWEKRNKTTEESLLEEMKERAEKYPPVAGKLLVLADSMPQGIVLHEITTEEAYLSVKGSAGTAASADIFKERAERIWQGGMTIRKKKIINPAEAVTFEIEGERQYK